MTPSCSLSCLLAIAISAILAGAEDSNPEDVVDPFEDHPGQTPDLPKEGLFTAAGLTVKPVEGWNPKAVSREDWPDIEPPIQFNQSFEAPTAVWRVDGGYLASFDAGEFGGALFFARQDAKRWSKILDAHVSHLERFEGDCYLAAGGLSHSETTEGRAFLLTIGKTGKWKAKLAFETQVGVPLILGTTFTNPFLEAKAEKLIVVALDSHWGWNPLFGISGDGAVHYLGERPKRDEPEGGDAEIRNPSKPKLEGDEKLEPGPQAPSR